MKRECPACRSTGLIAVDVSENDAESKIQEESCPWCAHEQTKRSTISSNPPTERAARALKAWKNLAKDLDRLSPVTAMTPDEIAEAAVEIRRQVQITMIRAAVMKAILEGTDEDVS